MHRSFIELAPPPVALADGLAVPIDIDRIDATLCFDPLRGDALDATVSFTTGLADGFPVFDLRQTIRAAWLDGSPFPVTRLSHEDLGGGPDAQMRVVRKSLTANTHHVLRVICPLSLPQARMNNRTPIVEWNNSRLTFRFGFTDLTPGRYLDSWIPANLIYDEFDLSLRVELAQTHVPHVLVTTGQAQQTGLNAWYVEFAQASACTPMFEVHAADRVEMMHRAIELPASRSHITIEAWKESDNQFDDLERTLDDLERNLSEFDFRLGRYIHGDRFVYLVDSSGGMEYAGGATGSAGSLRHELVHSWWARGIRPANQADGWIDEAIARWIEFGARSTRIDTSASSREILSRLNLWSRVTPRAAYGQGSSVFQEMALSMGLGRLESILRDLFHERAPGPITTRQLEAFLLQHRPIQGIVDSFHKFVYGLPDHSTPTDLRAADPADCGFDTPWDHPSLWVRNSPDGSEEHQSPQVGGNSIYARLRNTGVDDVGHAALVARLHPQLAFDPSGAELPDHAAAVSIQLDWKAGEERLIEIPWNLEQFPESPSAISLQILSQGTAMADLASPFDGLVWKSTVQRDVVAGDEIGLPVCIGNRLETASQTLRLTLRRPTGFADVEAVLTHSVGLPLIPEPPTPYRNRVSEPNEPVTEKPFPAGIESHLLLELSPASLLQTQLALRLPDSIPSNVRLVFHLFAVRPGDDTVVGGISVVLNTH